MRAGSVRTFTSGGLALLLAAVLLVGCKGRSEAPVAAAAPDAWPALVNEWIESDFKANPNAAAYQGRHEYDGLFPDWSAAGLAAEAKRLQDWQTRVQAIDAGTLTESAKFEREYLLSQIDGRLFWLVTSDWPHKNPTFYYMDPGLYLDRPYADLATRMKAYTLWASNLPQAAAQIKDNLKGPLPRAFIDIGMHTFGPLGDFLQHDVAKVFAAVDDAALQAEFNEAEPRRCASPGRSAEAPGKPARHADRRLRDGRELFAAMLKANELVDTPLAELEAMGRGGSGSQQGGAGRKPARPMRRARPLRNAWRR